MNAVRNITTPAVEGYADGVYKDIEVCRGCKRLVVDYATEELVRMNCLENTGPWKGQWDQWEYEDEFEDGYAPKTCRSLDRLRCIKTLREL